MRIGAVSGFSSMQSLQSNYRVSSINGNPKQFGAVERIGEQQYSGNPLAIVSKKDDAEDEKIREQQSKPFDLDGAVKRMQQGLATTATDNASAFNMDDAIGRMMQGSIFSADSIPVASIT